MQRGQQNSHLYRKNNTEDTSIFTRTRGPLNIKDQADRSTYKEVGPNK
jgi:hypothetical protein